MSETTVKEYINTDDIKKINLDTTLRKEDEKIVLTGKISGEDYKILENAIESPTAGGNIKVLDVELQNLGILPGILEFEDDSFTIIIEKDVVLENYNSFYSEYSDDATINVTLIVNTKYKTPKERFDELVKKIGKEFSNKYNLINDKITKIGKDFVNEKTIRIIIKKPKPSTEGGKRSKKGGKKTAKKDKKSKKGGKSRKNKKSGSNKRK
jgi:hypothetical protein